MPAELTSASAGGQLYGQFAQLLAPADSLDGTSSIVILEPAGKDISVLGAMADPAAAEALADLANAVPAAATSFQDTGRVYDDMWKVVIEGAVASKADDPAWLNVARIVSENRADFELMGRAREGLADLFHPVLTSPRDWLSADGWSSVSFRISGEETDAPPPPPPEVVIPEAIPDLAWRQLDKIPEVLATAIAPAAAVPPVADPAEPMPLEPVFDIEDDPNLTPEERKFLLRKRKERFGDRPVPRKVKRPMDYWKTYRKVTEVASQVAVAEPERTGFELSFDYRVVGLQRPWLHVQLCHLTGWTIPGLASGGVSNGRLTGNPGLIPVITTRMLVVRNLVVAAHWSEADRARGASAGTISFGPFAVTGEAGFDGSRMSRPAPQVVAWLACAVPECPR